MTFDTKRWLTEELGFTAEQAEALAPQFADRTEKIQAGYVGPAERQAFTAKQTEIANAQRQLEEANAKLSDELRQWAEMTAKEKAQSPALAAELEASRVRAAQLEARLTTLATQSGLDPKTLLENIAPAPEPKKEPTVAPVDTSKFVTREQVAPIFDYQLDLPATLLHIQAQHQQLFGETLDPRKITAEIKARAAKNDQNIDPIAIWEGLYKVPEKREAVNKAKYDADIAAAEARGREAAMTERAMPGPADPGRHAPIFRNGQGQFQPRTSRLSRPQPEAGVRSAAAALASGKYRVADTGARG